MVSDEDRSQLEGGRSGEGLRERPGVLDVAAVIRLRIGDRLG